MSLKSCAAISAKVITAGIEVVDNANRPICILEKDEVIGQNLCHRAVALLLRDNAGRYLLRRPNGESWGFSAHEPLVAGLAAAEFCQVLARQSWNLEIIAPVQAAFHAPSPENGNAFTSLFCVLISSGALNLLAVNEDEYLLADAGEIRALIQMGYPFDPFFPVAFGSIFADYGSRP